MIRGYILIVLLAAATSCRTPAIDEKMVDPIASELTQILKVVKKHAAEKNLPVLEIKRESHETVIVTTGWRHVDGTGQGERFSVTRTPKGWTLKEHAMWQVVH